MIVDLLFPRRCPVCDEPVPVGDILACRECKEKIKYIHDPKCKKCGKQLTDETRIFCNDCQSKKHIFEYGYGLYDYHSMEKSIYKFKYHGRSEYAKFYARDIYNHLGPQIQAMNADSIVPVPLHKDKYRARGYNQAELIAKELSELSGIPVYSDLVIRTRNTVPQKELDDVGRQNNLKKAFNISSDVVKLNKTIVVDDIYTTGSTIDAVSTVLKQHGVNEVYFITLCIGEGM